MSMDDNVSFDELKKAINKLGKEYVFELTQQLLEAGSVASGRLINSLNYEVIELLNGIYLNMKYEKYLINVDQGRRPGAKPPGSSKILPWIKQKGIKGRGKGGRFISNQSLAYLISRSIGKKGIKPTNVIKKAKQRLMANKTELLGKAATKDVMNSLNKILNNL
jgi:hypothetical protein